MAGLYDTTTLVEVVRSLNSPSSFLLDMFFGSTIESEAAEIAIDVEAGTRTLAPFVSPLMKSKLVEQAPYQTTSFKPAYIKMRSVPDVRAPLKRAIGEKVGGALSPAEREAAIVGDILAKHLDMVARRMEWMAAQALITGTVPVVGDGVNVTVNFGRDAALTPAALSGAARWGQAGVKPGDQLEDMADTIGLKSGAAVTDIVLTKGPARALRDALGTAIQAARPNDVNLPLGGLGGVTLPGGARLLGTFGTFNLWVYNELFVDPVDNVEKPLLPEGAVILGSRKMDGRRVFGSIVDPEFNYGALAFAPKSWIEHDPGQRVLMTQSAPMVVPFRVNAAAALKVM